MKNYSALLLKYQEQIRKNPGSRVFAPLAETYRKLGLFDDAYKLLKQGIKRHPQYVLGYLVLAQCYNDQGKKEAAYQLLKPLVGKNKDNIALMRLYAQLCRELNEPDAALETLKWLLFLNPSDKELALDVKQLEDELHLSKTLKPSSTIRKAPQSTTHSNQNLTTQNSKTQTDEDDWTWVNFIPESKFESLDLKTTNQPNLQPSTDLEWATLRLEHHQEKENSIAPPPSLDDDYYADEFANEASDTVETGLEKTSPLISHTLVDLYISQGHLDLAQEFLEKILQTQPQDEKSLKKYQEIKNLRQQDPSLEAEVSAEDALAQMVQNQVHKPQSQKLIKYLENFHHLIRLTSQQKMSRYE